MYNTCNKYYTYITTLTENFTAGDKIPKAKACVPLLTQSCFPGRNKLQNQSPTSIFRHPIRNGVFVPLPPSKQSQIILLSTKSVLFINAVTTRGTFELRHFCPQRVLRL